MVAGRLFMGIYLPQFDDTNSFSLPASRQILNTYHGKPRPRGDNSATFSLENIMMREVSLCAFSTTIPTV
jgi:hypothetical protein